MEKERRMEPFCLYVEQQINIEGEMNKVYLCMYI